MKKLAIPAICTLIGCAAGVAMPATTAQTAPTATATAGSGAPAAQRQNYCAFELLGADDASEYNRRLQTLGAEGWELVAIAPSGIPCFTRPPQ